MSFSGPEWPVGISLPARKAPRLEDEVDTRTSPTRFLPSASGTGAEESSGLFTVAGAHPVRDRKAMKPKPNNRNLSCLCIQSSIENHSLSHLDANEVPHRNYLIFIELITFRGTIGNYFGAMIHKTVLPFGNLFSPLSIADNGSAHELQDRRAARKVAQQDTLVPPRRGPGRFNEC